uniref:Uncharacterized protein n=1 Tax=Nymphaea colorata TaxID=210225 RepID=A0A5K1FTE1_9MAGN
MEQWENAEGRIESERPAVHSQVRRIKLEDENIADERRSSRPTLEIRHGLPAYRRRISRSPLGRAGIAIPVGDS